jgi:hypothetical protein
VVIKLPFAAPLLLFPIPLILLSFWATEYNVHLKQRISIAEFHPGFTKHYHTQIVINLKLPEFIEYFAVGYRAPDPSFF